ncbi:MAG: hypothetical protein SGBAC_010286 [Bacillariaceae sp.]
MKKSDGRQASMVSEKNSEKLQNTGLQLRHNPSAGDDEVDNKSIELASLHSHSQSQSQSQSQSTKSKKKKKKKKNKKSKKDTGGKDESVASSAKLKKKKKPKKTKDGKKSRNTKKESQSQSSCSISEFSISSLDTFAFDDASHESDQDSCYKSTAGILTTPVGLPKKKLMDPSSAPLGNEPKESTLVPKATVADLGAWMLSQNKQSEQPMETRRARRIRVKGGASLNSSCHGSTPTSNRRMTLKIEKSLHKSMPDLFASPGRESLDSSPGRVGRRRRLNSEATKPWTPRAPTLTRRHSSKSLMDEIGNSSLRSFTSSNDSIDNPFESAANDKPANASMAIPDLFGDSSDDDDGGLAYHDPFASSPGRTSKKKPDTNIENNPFELVTPSRQSSTLMDARQPSKAYVEHGEFEADGSSGRHGGITNLSWVSPKSNMESKVIQIPDTPPVQENDESESSFEKEEFLTPNDRGPHKKILLSNLIGANNNINDDERSLDVTDLFGVEMEQLVEELDSDSASDFAFDSPFSAMNDEKSKKVVTSKALVWKVIAPTSNFADEMNRSFHDAMAVDPFESSGDLADEMNRSFHDALSADPFESSEECKTEPSVPHVSTKKSFRGKGVADTSSSGDGMNRSFHDALNLDPFESEEFGPQETSGVSGMAVSSRNNALVQGMNRSFHDPLSTDINPLESEEMKFEVDPMSFAAAESPVLGDMQRNGVVAASPEPTEPQRVYHDEDFSSACTFSSSDPDNTADGPNHSTKTSLSGFINKMNHDNSSLGNSSIGENSKKSRSSFRSNSLDRLKALGRRSNSRDRLKLPGRRSKSRDRLKFPNRQSSIDDLICLQKRAVSKPWNRLRSAVSSASVVSCGSEATKIYDEGSSPSTNASWSIHSKRHTDPQAGQLKADGRRRARKSELSLSEHGANGCGTRRSSGLGKGLGSTKKVSRSLSKDKLTKGKKKKKKKKNLLDQPEHSTMATTGTRSPARGKELDLGTNSTKVRTRASKTKSKSRPPASLMLMIPQSQSKEGESQDHFRQFLTERALQPDCEDIFSC